ncbi:hypothetical protein GQ600_23179 [Phytophthora cactorum]|nr:hypothetical protein GQ600_23179 [Phytophthora cactorum]
MFLYRLPKVEVDEATGNQRYPDNFQVVYSDGSTAVSATAAPNDGAVSAHYDKQIQRQASLRPEESTPTMQGWLYKQVVSSKTGRAMVVAREGKMMYYHGMSDATPLDIEAHEVNARNKCLHFFKSEQDLVGGFTCLVLSPLMRNNTFATRASYQQEYHTYARVLIGDVPQWRCLHASAFSTLHDVRLSTQLSATELAFQLTPSEASHEDVKVCDDVSAAAHRALDMRSLSFTDNEDQEGDRLSSTSASAMLQCYQLSLHAVQPLYWNCPDPDPDPVHSAANGRKASPPGSLSRQFHQYVVQKRMGDAEQLLTELIVVNSAKLEREINFERRSRRQQLLQLVYVICHHRILDRFLASSANS